MTSFANITRLKASREHHVHLAREFRRHFGCTIGQFMRQRRVEFGSHRLTASTDSLAEIAFDAGFADQSHFANVFRGLVGMSPGAFRMRFAESARNSLGQALIRFKTASVTSG
jgi:AraC-like DNA-binding protein